MKAAHALFTLMTLVTTALLRVTAPAESADAQLKEVRKWLREVPLIDGHNDVPWQYRKFKADFDVLDLATDSSQTQARLVTDIAR